MLILSSKATAYRWHSLALGRARR